MEAELKNVNEQLKDNKLEKFATACDTAGTKMESFGKKMSVVSAGIAGIGAASIAAFKELDEGYDTIVTKTGATGEALEGLTKSADNVFGTMPEDMSTVGEAIGEVNTRFHTTGTELEKTSKQFIQFATTPRPLIFPLMWRSVMLFSDPPLLELNQHRLRRIEPSN